MRLQAFVGSVCVGGTALMPRGRECARLGLATRRRVLGSATRDASPSTRRWTVEVYVPQDPHQGAVVVFRYTYVLCECYTPNIYRCICM